MQNTEKRLEKAISNGLKLVMGLLLSQLTTIGQF
jgi:hypothetical protein